MLPLGRVGENGQNGLFDKLDLEGALAKFEEKFKAKTVGVGTKPSRG